MRLSVLPAIAAVSLVGTACTDDVLTGPEAQEAFVEARAVADALPHDAVIYLDDVLVGEDVVATLEPSGIQRIEIRKTRSSGNRESDQPSEIEIRIYTKQAAEGEG